MVKLKKSISLLIIISFCLILFSGCQREVEDFSDNEETASETTMPTEEPAEEISFIFTQQPSSMAVPLNQSHTLACTAEYSDSKVYYRWFECTDSSGTSKTPISNNWTENSNIEIEAFTAKGIRYFVCCASTYIPQGNEIPANSIYSDIVAVAYTGLPLIKIDTGDISTSQITRENYVPCSIIITQPDGSENEYQLTKKGIKGRGNSSWGMPKKGYNLNFDDKTSLFGMPESKKWCFTANYSDKTLLRNKYASVLGNTIFNIEWNPSMKSVDIIMNGEYIGNYLFTEKISIETTRINIQDIYDVEENLLKTKTNKITDSNGDGKKDLYDGGFILEIDARYDANYYFTTTRGLPVILKEPDDISKYTGKHIQNIVQIAEDAVYSENFEDTENGWRKYIDESSLIDWYLVNELAKNVDAPFYLSDYFLFNSTDGKLHFGPNWDFDIGFGNANYTNDSTTSSCEEPEGWYIKNAQISSFPNWLIRIFEDSVFVENLKQRWNNKKLDILQTIQDNESTETIQTLADENLLSAELNFQKWKILGIYVWPNSSGYENRNTYQSEIDYMKDWLTTRYAWMDSAINSL